MGFTHGLTSPIAWQVLPFPPIPVSWVKATTFLICLSLTVSEWRDGGCSTVVSGALACGLNTDDTQHIVGIYRRLAWLRCHFKHDRSLFWWQMLCFITRKIWSNREREVIISGKWEDVKTHEELHTNSSTALQHSFNAANSKSIQVCAAETKFWIIMFFVG